MEPHDESPTLTDDDIETQAIRGGSAAGAGLETPGTGTGDDSGDTSDTSDTGDDSGDPTDTTDTGDDSGDTAPA